MVGSNIVDMRERTNLRTIAKDSQRFAAKDLIHEDADNVAIAIANILALAIDVMRPKNDVIEVKHFMADFQFLFDSQLRNTVRILRYWDHIFPQRRLASTIYGDGRSEHQAPNVVIDACIYDIYGSDQIVVVIESLDEVAKALGGVGRQVINVS